MRTGAVLKNEFSWSWSRHGLFSGCRRRYWLTHYGSWGGWDSSAPDEVREAYVQKQLSSRPQWVGTAVHEAAAWILQEVRSGRHPERARVVEQFRRKALRSVEDSRDGRHRYFPKRYTGFEEHYYGVPEVEAYLLVGVEEIVTQVEGLYENPVFQRLVDVPGRIREVERLEQLHIAEVPVWVSLDVLVEDGQGGLVVVDWKTGQHHDPQRIAGQLGLYGLYVLSRYLGVSPERWRPQDLERIKTMWVNLRSGDREVLSLEPGHVQGLLDLVRRSAAEMRALVPDGQEMPERSAFPMLPEGDEQCARCAFRRTCERE